MLRPRDLPPRVRAAAAGGIHGAWNWLCEVAAVGPGDARGRRYRAMGEDTCIAFPPGPVYGEHWISIGARTMIGAHVTLAVGMPFETFAPDADPIIVIGDRCSIGRGSSIVARCGVVLEDDITIAPNVYITDHNHTYDDVALPISQQWPADNPVRIGAGSWLATNVVVLPGADIGQHVTVAAGSVVRGRVPDFSVVAGAPARVVRRYVEGEGWQSPAPRVESC